MKTFIRKIDWLGDIPHGYGNGYVIIPKGHKCYGLSDLENKFAVHGGITFNQEVTKEMLDQWDRLVKQIEEY